MNTCRMSGTRAQSSVEVLSLLPVLVTAALAAAQFLAAQSARELAHHAAEAGAVAVLEGDDAPQAARQAVPGAARERLRVSVRGRRVAVTLSPVTIVPGLATLLQARAVATAGDGA